MKAIDVHRRPDLLVWRVFMDIPMRGWSVFPESGWPSYDIQSMKSSAENTSGRDELFTKIVGDVRVQGFTHNKALRRGIIGDIRFDESLIYAEDEVFFLNILECHEHLRVCYLDYYLYCYVQHKATGLLRDPANQYDNNGVTRFMSAQKKILAMKNIPPSASNTVKGRIYALSLQNLFNLPETLTPAAYNTLRANMHKYARYYYLNLSYTMREKVRAFIKHILVLLHIHKPRRK